jgi:CheY-like chemotaxis protein
MPHSPEHAQGDLSVRHPLSKPRHESSSDSSRPAVAKHCPVLIVDDELDLREMMAQLLTLEGFQAATVANGVEALNYLSGSDTPDVILLDLMMPVMDGWEFRRKQQADPKLSRVPTIVVTALTREQTQAAERARAVDLKPAAFLRKPLDFDLLLQLVRQYCH